VTDDLLEGRPNGRIIKIDTATWSATVVATGLYFANGVILSADESQLIFSETYAARLSVLDLKSQRVTPLLSTHFIDNLSPGPKEGTFWASIVLRRDAFLDTVAGSAILRRLLRKVPAPVKPYTGGLLLDEKGDVELAFQDPAGQLIHGTSVYASYRNRLYIGTYKEHGIVSCPLK
jgi:hypothetical protein